MMKGTGVALVTPFAQDGSVDYDSLQNIIDHVINEGVEYIVALGTTAETPTLNEEEKEAVLDFILLKTAGRVPVVCGIGGNNTHEVVQQIKRWDDKKFDTILSVCPYYNKPTQTGLQQHFAAIAQATSKKIILYNVPGRTMSNIQPDTVVQLAQTYSNIVAIKEASGNMAQVMELMRKKPSSFTVLSGDDNLVLPQIAVGFDGVISVAANCYTKEFTDMVRLALNEKFGEAREKHYRLLEGIDLLFMEGNPTGVKYVMYQKGLLKNNLRLPLVPASSALAEKINSFLEQL